MAFTHRLASEEDIPALRALMTRAIESLQTDFLTPAQVKASHGTMGLDSQLVADRTYFVVEEDGVPAGCGGWWPRSVTSAAWRSPTTSCTR